MVFFISSIAINPSHSLLATGGLEPNDLALYSLPELSPCGLGEGYHSDWLFDIAWIDDALLLTGGRDGRISLWKVPDTIVDPPVEEEPVPKQRRRLSSVGSKISKLVPPIKPLTSVNINTEPDDLFESSQNNRVRAIAVNNGRLQFAALTLECNLALFDINHLKMLRSVSINQSENVCLAYSPKNDCYAVGSRGVILLFDSRSLAIVKRIRMPEPDCAVRSLSFASVSPSWTGVVRSSSVATPSASCTELLTIGTGGGGIMFYNLYTMSFVTICKQIHTSAINQTYGDDSTSCSPRSFTHHSLSLETTPGWFKREEAHEALHVPPYWSHRSRHQAIFTHSFDSSGMRLFTAGGPLPGLLLTTKLFF